jgi:hypothetical protein
VVAVLDVEAGLEAVPVDGVVPGGDHRGHHRHALVGPEPLDDPGELVGGRVGGVVEVHADVDGADAHVVDEVGRRGGGRGVHGHDHDERADGEDEEQQQVGGPAADDVHRAEAEVHRHPGAVQPQPRRLPRLAGGPELSAVTALILRKRMSSSATNSTSARRTDAAARRGTIVAQMLEEAPM